MYLGAFGEVRMCVHRESGAQRAVKVLRKKEMDEEEKKMLFNEISILRDLVSVFLAYYCPIFLLFQTFIYILINRITLILLKCMNFLRMKRDTILLLSKFKLIFY